MRLPWQRPAPDPFWEFFINEPVADPRNDIVHRIRNAREGAVYPVKTETHSPEVMARHVKELARFFGADLTAIVRLAAEDAQAADGGEPYPYGVVCVFRSPYQGWEAPGIGARTGALKGAFATFQIAAIIREWGFRATRSQTVDGAGLAAAAGLGTVDRAGRLVTAAFGPKVHVADVILTDLPVQPDATQRPATGS